MKFVRQALLDEERDANIGLFLTDAAKEWRKKILGADHPSCRELRSRNPYEIEPTRNATPVCRHCGSTRIFIGGPRGRVGNHLLLFDECENCHLAIGQLGAFQLVGFWDDCGKFVRERNPEDDVPEDNVSLFQELADLGIRPDEHAIVSEAFKKLSLEDQQVLYAHLVHGYTETEIAKTLGISQPAVCKRLKTIKQRISV